MNMIEILGAASFAAILGIGISMLLNIGRDPR